MFGAPLVQLRLAQPQHKIAAVGLQSGLDGGDFPRVIAQFAHRVRQITP